MSDENGKERKQKKPPENPVGWVAKLDPDVLAGMLFGLSKRFEDELKKKGDAIKVKLPGALVRMVEQFALFLARTEHTDMGDPVEFLVQSVLISQAMILTRKRQKGELGDRNPASDLIMAMVEGVAKDIAERGKDLGPEEFVALLRRTLEEIGLDPGHVAVCTEKDGKVNCEGCSRDPATCPIPEEIRKRAKDGSGPVQVIAVPRPPEKAADNEEEDLPTAPTDRPGAS